MNETIEDENLKKIHKLLLSNPGLHLSKIAELLDMRISEVDFYLQYLQKKELVFIIKEAGYQKYFINDQRVKSRDKRALDTKKKIYDLIVANPGLHLSKIAALLDMSIPLTDYHLVQMERDNEICVVKDARGYYKRYYMADSGIDVQERDILELLRRKIPLKIVLLLLKHSNMQHKEIMKHLAIKSTSTLSYHLTNLLNNGIVEVHPHGKEKGYVLKNKDEIIRILKKYELQIELHLAVDGFKDLWNDLSYRDSLMD